MPVKQITDIYYIDGSYKAVTCSIIHSVVDILFEIFINVDMLMLSQVFFWYWSSKLQKPMATQF